MSLYPQRWLNLTVQQAENLNAFLSPAYATPPTDPYVPSGVFAYMPNTQLPNAVNDSQFSQEQRDYLSLIINGNGTEEFPGNKTYEEAIALGWIQEPNDG